MIRRFPKYFWRLMAVCLVLALPTIGSVMMQTRADEAAIAHIEREKVGLTASLAAEDLLLAVERYRVALLDDGPGGARDERSRAVAGARTALAALHVPALLTVAGAGPRTALGELDQRWREIGAIASPTDRGLATVPFAESVLALLLDIDDASGLTYDPTVTSVNLSDALVSRLPSQAERRDRAAELIDLARRRERLSPFDISAAEMSAGEAKDALAAALDDLEGAAEAIPAIEPVLRQDRDALEAGAQTLGLAINAVALDGRSPRARTISALRRSSIAANERLYRTTEGVLAAAFDKRIAAERVTIAQTLGAGAAALAATAGAVMLLLYAMRRRSQREIDRANERAQALEAGIARRNAERALRMTEQQFRAVFDGSQVGIAMVDRAGALLDANDVFRAMFDCEPERIIDVARTMFADLERAEGSAISAEHRFAIAGRPPLWAHVSLSFIQAEGDDAGSAIVLVHDITEHKTMHASLDHQTLHDPLTQLPNRMFFIRRLEALLARPHERFAVLFIDLDGFKGVNDTLGHHAGDRVLRAVAQRLTEAVRACDFVARLHGDEFAVLLADLPDAGSSEIETVTTRLETALRLRVDTAGTPIVVSGSIGVVRSHARYADAEGYLRDADSAMYRSKVSGGGRATVFEPVAAPIELTS